MRKLDRSPEFRATPTEPTMFDSSRQRAFAPGIVDLELRARAADGSIATHALRTLGRRRLTAAIARRALAANYATPGGDADSDVHGCVSENATHASCTVEILSNGAVDSWRAHVTLSADGWLWTTEHKARFRIELP